jgi:hypothetical protein
MPRPFRMTRPQYTILEFADPQTRIIPRHIVDRRCMPRLLRREWVVRVQDRKRGNKVWYRWEITEAGLEARANAEIRDPTPRPDWRGRPVTRLSSKEYVLAGYTISRPAQTMLWRVFCPARGSEPVGYRTLIAEAADLLAHHVLSETEHGTPRDPGVPRPEAPDPIDLDHIGPGADRDCH